jgi:hypothetical protein
MIGMIVLGMIFENFNLKYNIYLVRLKLVSHLSILKINFYFEL